MRPHICAHKGKAEFTIKSDTPGTWSLTKTGREPWIHITLACSNTNSVVSTLATNDANLVKQTLAAPSEGLSVKSFQVVFSGDFPNTGVGVADVHEFKEEQTKRGVIFHSITTKFGCFRFGGPVVLMASQVKFRSEVVLYTAERPHY